MEEEPKPTVLTGMTDVAARMQEHERPISHRLELFNLFRIGTYWWTCGLMGADVLKFPVCSEKPGGVGRIGMVQRVHQPLYKISIGVRGVHSWRGIGNNVGTVNPMCTEFFPHTRATLTLLYKRGGCASCKEVPLCGFHFVSNKRFSFCM